MASFATAEPGPRDPDDWSTPNVWRPAGAASGGSAGLPVTVWTFGGAWSSGTSSNPAHDGARIAREGRVVLVTANCRVGPEGFPAIEGAPPNRGLLDQLAVLRWVHAEIERFGGDPGRVTVFGQSAGAGSLACLLAMPATAGLVHGAALSSVPRSHLTPDLADAVGAALLEEECAARGAGSPAALVIAAGAAAPSAARLGARAVLGGSLLIFATGLAWMGLAPVNGSFVTDLLGPTLVIGLGLGGAFVPVTAIGVADAPSDQAGVAGGLIDTSRQIGGAIGLAALVALATTRTSNVLSHGSTRLVAVNHGYAWAFFTAAAVALLAAVLATAGVRRNDAAETTDT